MTTKNKLIEELSKLSNKELDEIIRAASANMYEKTKEKYKKENDEIVKDLKNKLSENIYNEIKTTLRKYLFTQTKIVLPIEYNIYTYLAAEYKNYTLSTNFSDLSVDIDDVIQKTIEQKFNNDFKKYHKIIKNKKISLKIVVDAISKDITEEERTIKEIIE